MDRRIEPLERRTLPPDGIAVRKPFTLTRVAIR